MTRRSAGDADALLDAAYAAVPDAQCKGLCQDGCGSLALTPLEQRRIAARHGKVLPLVDAPALHGARCKALNLEGRCSVYDNRPMLCRLYGAVENLRCPYGCEPAAGLMTERAGRLALERVQMLSRRAGATDMLADGDR